MSRQFFVIQPVARKYFFYNLLKVDSIEIKSFAIKLTWPRIEPGFTP